MNDDTSMCERHEANYIQSGGYQNRDSHDSYSRQTHYDRPKSNNDSEITHRIDKRCRKDPPPPPARTEHVNVVFTVSGKSDDPPKIQNDPPPLIIVNNKFKDKPFKARGTCRGRKQKDTLRYEA
ncbi:hypothetical protein Tco_0832929 [Tanacetum coccineum]